MASVPAARRRESLAAQVVVAAAPVESVLKLLVVLSQVPEGVAPPAPATPLVMSHYLVAATARPAGSSAASAAAHAPASTAERRRRARFSLRFDRSIRPAPARPSPAMPMVTLPVCAQTDTASAGLK